MDTANDLTWREDRLWTAFASEDEQLSVLTDSTQATLTEPAFHWALLPIKKISPTALTKIRAVGENESKGHLEAQKQSGRVIGGFSWRADLQRG